jgi:transposase
MKLHGNAALSWSGRRRLAERVVVERWTLKTAAEAAGVSVRCARKWVGRYRLEGERGLLDRSSRPKRVANQTPEERIRLIVAMRRLRFTAWGALIRSSCKSMGFGMRPSLWCNALAERAT